MVKATPLSASHSDSASPVGLEFWLPGKISVLGERGLSFACSHPSCTTRKGPLSASPVYEEHLHWWSALFCLCLSCGEAAAAAAAAPFFFSRSGFFFYSTRSPEGFGCGASGMWALWEQHHPQTQTTAIDFSVNSNEKKKTRERRRKKNTKRNNSNTHTKKKNLVYWTIHFFQSVDTALTKYSTLRIVHIGRTEEGGKTCGPGFSLASLNRLSLLIPAKKSNPKG